MQGYYDYHPLVTLDRHLVVAGYFGAETRQIGYQLAALNGLGFSDLDRTIEHYAGKSIWELVWTEGEERYRRLERRHLRRLLAARPLGVITLGDGTLIDEANRRRVLDEAHLVVLDLDLPNCYWRIKGGPLADEEYWHPLYPGPIERFEQIRPFHELREPGFAEASHRIDLRGKGRSEAVDRLMEIVAQ